MSDQQPPARPTVSREMILEAAKVVAEKLNGADAATIAEHYTHPMDGFELCKQIDKWACWDTTRDDMETLDEMEWLVSEALRDAENEWAIQNMITPPVPVGAAVKCDRGVGVITGICSYGAARYEVKPEGWDDEKSGCMRWIEKFEDVESVAREA